MGVFAFAVFALSLLSPPTVIIGGRIAMILIYIAPPPIASPPPFFTLFIHFARMQKDKADWFVFTDLPESLCSFYNRPESSNFKVIHFGTYELAKRIVGVLLDTNIGDAEAMKALLLTFPYALVELKPLLASIFADFVPLHDYSYWGYYDLDAAIPRLPGTGEMRGVDVYTSSYGDNQRLYIRGQLSIFRNSVKVNNLWKGCDTLARFGSRLRVFLKRGGTTWRFESAEACFSRAVFGEGSNTSVRIRTDQISDASGGAAAQREFSYSARDRVIYRCDGRDYLLERQLLDAPLRINHSNPKCSYWMNPKYALCLSEPRPPSLLIDIDRTPQGRLSASSMPRLLYPLLPAGCREGSLGHFQGFKRRYYCANSLVDFSAASTVAFTQHGVVGLRGATAAGPRNHEAAMARLHCSRFTDDLRYCSQLLLPSSIHIHSAPASDALRGTDDVTLIRAAPLHGAAGMPWSGPEVFVGGGCGGPGLGCDRTGIKGDDSTTITLVDVDAPASAAARYNIALDVARTDLVLLLPAGAPLPSQVSMEAALARVRREPMSVLRIALETRDSPSLLSRALLLNVSGSAHGRVAYFPEELGSCSDAFLFVLRGLGYTVISASDGSVDTTAAWPVCGGGRAARRFIGTMSAHFRRCAELREASESVL